MPANTTPDEKLPDAKFKLWLKAKVWISKHANPKDDSEIEGLKNAFYAGYNSANHPRAAKAVGGDCVRIRFLNNWKYTGTVDNYSAEDKDLIFKACEQYDKAAQPSNGAGTIDKNDE